MSEINVYWRLIQEEDRLPTRTKEWWEHQHVSWANNRTSQPRTPRQFGGNALLFINKAAHPFLMAPIHKKQARRLHCKDPRLISNFNALFKQFAQPYYLFDRVTQLDNRKQAISKEAAINEYEAIDLIRCKAAAFAESKCRKLRKGSIAFSPDLNAA